MLELDQCVANVLGSVDTVVFDVHAGLPSQHWIHTSRASQAMAAALIKHMVEAFTPGISYCAVHCLQPNAQLVAKVFSVQTRFCRFSLATNFKVLELITDSGATVQELLSNRKKLCMVNTYI